MILAGVFIGIPVTILLSTKTVIDMHSLFNIYAVLAVICCVLIPFLKKRINSWLFLTAFILIGLSPVIMALLLILNTYIPTSAERYETYKIESISVSAGTLLLQLENNKYKDDPGIRRFDPQDLKQPPRKMMVKYTFRRGLLGYDVVRERRIE